MSKNMLALDPIIRALVGVGAKHLGIVLDLANKLAGTDADTVHTRVAQALRGEALSARARSTKAKVEYLTDSLIHVDRSFTPSYPDWMKQIMHPELANTGPAEYDISSVNPWLHPDQDNVGTTTGKVIYKHLEDNEMLKSCLNLQDGLAIKAKGIEFFRKHFSGKAVFLWGSVVQNRSGGLYVPCLLEYDGRVVVYWSWLDRDWGGDSPALRFAS